MIAVEAGYYDPVEAGYYVPVEAGFDWDGDDTDHLSNFHHYDYNKRYQVSILKSLESLSNLDNL